MIVIDGVHARAREDTATSSAIKGLSLTWERGLLAVLGSPADGTTALLETIAGVAHVRAGSVLVNGQAPSNARASIAYVRREVTLPDGLRVDEVCDLAGSLRAEPAQPAASRLAALGLEALAMRRTRSLSNGEARAVSLALALTSKASVLVVDEPLVGLDPSATARVVGAMRARATTSAMVVTTASVRDATRLADQLGLLTRGAYSHLAPSSLHVDKTGAKLRVVIRADAPGDVASFLGALSQQPSITSVETSTFAPASVPNASMTVIVTGRDLLTVARAVGLAAAAARTNVLAIESCVVSLEAVRAALLLDGLCGVPAAPSGDRA